MSAGRTLGRARGITVHGHVCAGPCRAPGRWRRGAGARARKRIGAHGSDMDHGNGSRCSVVVVVFVIEAMGMGMAVVVRTLVVMIMRMGVTMVVRMPVIVSVRVVGSMTVTASAMSRPIRPIMRNWRTPHRRRPVLISWARSVNCRCCIVCFMPARMYAAHPILMLPSRVVLRLLQDIWLDVVSRYKELLLFIFVGVLKQLWRH